MAKKQRILIGTIFYLIFSLPALAQEVVSNPWKSNISVASNTGTPLTIYGTILESDGQPIEGAGLWIYHTDADGYYARDENGQEEGWRYADYSARLKSGPDGKFEVETIRPAGYPDSINPAHLHIRVDAPGYPELEYTAYFEGGDRITGEIKNLVKKYGTMFLLPVDTSEDGSQAVTWQIKLLKDSPY